MVGTPSVDRLEIATVSMGTIRKILVSAGSKGIAGQLTTGDTIEAVSGVGASGVFNDDSTGITLTITKVSNGSKPAPASPAAPGTNSDSRQ
jgi:hypothetical protein